MYLVRITPHAHGFFTDLKKGLGIYTVVCMIMKHQSLQLQAKPLQLLYNVVTPALIDFSFHQSNSVNCVHHMELNQLI